MNRQNFKQLTIAALAIFAFVFGVCINPADDSPTFFADFLKVKLIAGIAVLLIVLIERYGILNNYSSK